MRVNKVGSSGVSHLSNLADAQLLGRMGQPGGDRVAFEELWGRHQEFLRRYACGHLSPRQAEDDMQTLALKLASPNVVASYDENKNVKTWLTAMLRNVSVDRWRKAETRKFYETGYQEHVRGKESGGLSLPEPSKFRELWEVVEIARQQGLDLEVLLLQMRDLPNEAIAAVLGLPTGTVKSKGFRQKICVQEITHQMRARTRAA